MNKIKIQFRHFEKLIQENSPTILTALGVVGTVGTAILVGRASWAAGREIEQQEVIASESTGDPNYEFNKRAKIERVWKLYLPAVGVGSATIACIVMSNKINARRLAAMTGAYALISKDYDEYKDKVYDTIGLKKADEVDQKVATAATEALTGPVGVLPDNKSWFMDHSSRRPFPSTTELVRGAVNELNFTILNNGDCSLTDFYAQVGLDPTGVSDKLGWNRDKKVQVKLTAVPHDLYGAITLVEFFEGPIPNFWK